MPTLEEHLDDALEALLAVRIKLEVDKRLPTPAMALDEALAADDCYRRAKGHLIDAVAQGADLLEIEAAINALVAKVTDRIWAVASMSMTTWRTP